MKRKKNTRRRIRLFAGIFLALCLLLAADAVANKASNKPLPEGDERMIRELEQVFQKDGEKGNPSYWQEYKLAHHPVLILNKESRNAYFINPKASIPQFLAKRIACENEMIDVYRIPRLYPGLWRLRLFGGNFNTIGKVTTVMNNSVYYLKYSSTDFKKNYSSQYPPVYLYHESFHYFMQTQWAEGGRFSGKLSQKGMDLLHEKCKLLDEAKAMLEAPEERSEACLSLVGKLLDLEEERLAEDPIYVRAERRMETTEGTATYMGILAARSAGYDFGTMYFDNKKDVPFSDVVPYYKDGRLAEGFLRDRLPYETGAQIALILHALDKEDRWQIFLNEQNLDQSRTLTDAMAWVVNNKLSQPTAKK